MWKVDTGCIAWARATYVEWIAIHPEGLVDAALFCVACMIGAGQDLRQSSQDAMRRKVEDQ
jgi:hypothetical protein